MKIEQNSNHHLPPLSPTTTTGSTGNTINSLIINIMHETKLKHHLSFHVDRYVHETEIHKQTTHYFAGTDVKDRLRDLIAGAVSGAAAKVVEYPLDSIKVLKQTQPMFMNASALTVATTAIRQYGWTSLFKGMSAPTIGATFENALVFSSYGQMKHVLGVQEGSWSSPQSYFAAGAGAGLVAGVVLTPIELIKCRLQTQNSRLRSSVLAQATFHGPVDLVRAEIASGGVRSLFRGLTPTLGREIIGNACWFGIYEWAVRTNAERLGVSRAEVPLYIKGACGALGGLAFWSIPYPFDTLKSILQSDTTNNHKGTLATFRNVIEREGIRGLYRGMPITLIRAAPEHFLLFYLYEATDSFLLTF
jgi:hypothetical protein